MSDLAVGHRARAHRTYLGCPLVWGGRPRESPGQERKLLEPAGR